MLLIALDCNYEANISIHASRGSDDWVGIIVLIKVFTELIIPLLDASAPHFSFRSNVQGKSFKKTKYPTSLFSVFQAIFETHTK